MAELGRWQRPSASSISSGVRVHSARVIREVEDVGYLFALPNFDGGRQRFGPAIGSPGMPAGRECFATMTIDGEWFIFDPSMQDIAYEVIP